MHGLDAGPIDLGHVRRVRQRERGGAEDHGIGGEPRELERGHPEPDQEDEQDRRYAA
jgi:hypothetical protein